MFESNKTDLLGPLIAQSTCQLFIIKPGTKELLIANACSILLKWNSKHYCISNAHVLADNNIENNFFYVGNGAYATMGGIITSTELPATGKRKDDLYDISIVELWDETVMALKKRRYVFITEKDIRFKHQISSDDSIIFVGYPSSQTKVKPVQKEIRPKHFSYITHPVIKDIIGTDFTNEHHITARYSRRNLYHPEHGNKVGPSPRGMSGSGIWLLEKQAAEVKPFLIGIFSEYDENRSIMIGSKIDLSMGIISGG